MSTVLYLLSFLFLGVALRRMFERGRKLAELRARVATLEAEQASQDRFA
jgi:BMFP domain-containing protein YqiC